MAARKGSKTLPLESVIGYADIADKMGVDVKSVRIYAGRDRDFPTPVTPASWRSPGFSEADVDRYLEVRKVRNSGRSGRPPRSVDGEKRLEGGREVGDRVRELLVSGESSVGSSSELARLVGLSTAALGFRLRGQVRWKPSEVEAVARALGVNESRLVVPASTRSAGETPAE
jgi:predicted DNA-binding transcriptional regulator AlpA